jgi:hypothetical protein
MNKMEYYRVRVMVFNATFSNISVISLVYVAKRNCLDVSIYSLFSVNWSSKT